MHRVFAPLVLALLVIAGPVSAQVPDAIKYKVAVCSACHGETGNTDNQQYPVLAGQSARYIYQQLQDFKAGRRRHDPNMDAVAATLSRDDMLALGEWFSTQKRAPGTFKADPAKAALGKQKADEVLCTMCHLGGFTGQNEIPRVAGQHYEYIKKQLSDFKARRRTNDAGNMTSVAASLTDEDIDNLAQYVSTLY